MASEIDKLFDLNTGIADIFRADTAAVPQLPRSESLIPSGEVQQRDVDRLFGHLPLDNEMLKSLNLEVSDGSMLQPANYYRMFDETYEALGTVSVPAEHRPVIDEARAEVGNQISMVDLLQTNVDTLRAA